MTTPPSPPGLGPHCVGLRVVVRRTVPGETGPSGGPALTDVLGVMESWDAETRTTVVRREDGSAVSIDLDHIVSGKPVPPRPSVRHRASAEEVQRRGAETWPAVVCEPLGDWLLRASSGYTRRANSVLAIGDPGRAMSEAASSVRSFYDCRGLPALAMVVVGSPEEAQLTELGWTPDGGDVVVLLGGVAAARRASPRSAREVLLTVEPDDRWLSADDRALAVPDAARAVLTGPSQVAFASALSPSGVLLARGRVALDDRPDPWASITDVWVAPEHRRRGLALAVVGALLDWVAERGATTVQLQVVSDNVAALALYERLRFTEHHRYRYLRGV